MGDSCERGTPRRRTRAQALRTLRTTRAECVSKHCSPLTPHPCPRAPQAALSREALVALVPLLAADWVPAKRCGATSGEAAAAAVLHHGAQAWTHRIRLCNAAIASRIDAWRPLHQVRASACVRALDSLLFPLTLSHPLPPIIQITAEVPEIVDGLVDVMRASVPEGCFELDPALKAPCDAAMAALKELVDRGDEAAVLRRGADGAVLVRAAVALLRQAPYVDRRGHWAGRASSLELFGVDAVATTLASAMEPAIRALRDGAAPYYKCRTEEDKRVTYLLRDDGDLRGFSWMIESPLRILHKLLKAAAAAAGAERPPVSHATARAVLGVAAAAIALLPPGAERNAFNGAPNWALGIATQAYMFLVRAAPSTTQQPRNTLGHRPYCVSPL